jgi:AraC family transcriptional regulator
MSAFPVPSSSRDEYEVRMHRVLAYIDKNLDQPLDLATLAGVAHFSPFHFHRLFAAWMNETLGDFLRRRRVEVAAMRMAAQPRLSVLNVALSVGFGSGEAFSRAFKLRFGASPTAWRMHAMQERVLSRSADQIERKPGQVDGNLGQEGIEAAPHTEASFNPLEIAMPTTPQVTLIDRQPTTVAYLRYEGPPGEPISQFWQTVYYPWAATHGLLEQPRYGISHDDPGIATSHKLRYDACVEVPVDFKPSGNALMTTLPGGRYAAYRFKGTGAEFPAGWTALLRDWLPSSGLQLDNRPSFEYYGRDAAYDPTTGVMTCDICIPVAPL